MCGQIHMHRRPATPKDIHIPEHVPPPRTSSPKITRTLQSLSSAATAPFAGRKMSLSLPLSQSQCWQSAEPGGDLKEATFLPRNPEKYQNLTPTFPFLKDGPSPGQEQLSQQANTSHCRMSWARMAGYPALKGRVNFPSLQLFQCWMRVWS